MGREHETGLLLDRWTQAKEGDGQVVLLSGEAGIGKSRITETLRERTIDDNPLRLSYQCSPFYTNTALHPVVEQLQRTAGINADDSNDTKLEKLEALLKQGPTIAKEVVPLFAPLLSISTEGHYAPLDMMPEQQKEQTLEGLLGQIEGLSRKRPVLFIFEDVHWADPTSLEFLELTIDRAQNNPFLVVLTYRPEFSPPWSEHTHVTSLTLNRFTRSLASSMVEGVTGGKPLPDVVLEQIIERTDGVPLFVEELTKTILESGILTEESDRYVSSGSLGEVAIPVTLHDSLMARLDRLGAVKEVAQTASAIGREFDYDLLGAVSLLSFEKLRDALDQLVDAGLLFRRGRSKEGGCIFKHALVQDAAYGSLLKSKRQQIHQRIAQALQDRFPERVDSRPELLGHHFTEAGMPETAVGYWVKAGHQALERSANREAVGHLSNGLRTLMKLPASDERDQSELDIQLALLHPLMNTTAKGFASDEANVAAARARELCESLGQPEKIGGVSWVENLTLLGEAKYDSSKRIGGELVELGLRHNDSMCVLCGLEGQGWSELAQGEFSSAMERADRMLDLYEPKLHSVHLSFKPIDPQITALGIRAYTTGYIGLPDQSRLSTERGIAYARELNHGPSLVWMLSCAGAMPAALRRDVSAAERLAQEVLELSDEQRSPLDWAWASIAAGWAIGKQGRLDEGIKKANEGLAYMAANFQVFLSAKLALVAELYIDAGRLKEAAEKLEIAATRIAELGECCGEVEVLRLKAQVCMRENQDFEKAESLLKHARDVARNQDAKSLELRACVSLGELWVLQDNQRAAYDLVLPIYESFTEGVGTADLSRAKALLDRLS